MERDERFKKFWLRLMDCADSCYERDILREMKDQLRKYYLSGEITERLNRSTPND